MRDVLFLFLVAAAFACGYVLMARLDRLFQRLRPEELPEQRPGEEASRQLEVESSCFPCYNIDKRRVMQGGPHSGRQEERPWRRQCSTRTAFLGQAGMTAGHRGS